MANPRGKFTFEGRNALVREQILKRLKSRDEREDTFTRPDDTADPSTTTVVSKPQATVLSVTRSTL